MNKNGKIGLVLSGGSLSGVVAHTGVLSILDDYKIDIDYVIGTSAGAIVGGLYCSGLSPYYIFDLIKKLKKRDIISISLRKFLKFGTILSNQKIKNIIEKELKITNWSLLEPQFAVVSVNISKGIKEVIKGGCKISEAMLSSSAIPFIFEPLKLGNDYYVDGGGVSNIPVKEAIETFPDIETLIISSLFDWDTSDNVYQSNNPYKGNLFTKTYNILNRYLKAGARELLSLQGEDVKNLQIISIDLRPVKRLGLFDFDDVNITFQQAREQAKKFLGNFEGKN
jgi:NTE family protein